MTRRPAAAHAATRTAIATRQARAMGGFVLFAPLACALAAGCAAGTAGPTTAPARQADVDVADQPVAQRFARYGPNPALRATLDAHVEAGGTRSRQSILMTTWFTAADARVGLWSTVDPEGRVATYRFVHEYAVQDAASTTLAEGQLPELVAVLAALPTAPPPPTIDRLLIVSFHKDGRWVTRAYDRTAPPPSLRHVFEQMTGAPLSQDTPG